MLATMESTATFGVDLAAQPAKTAACLIEWDQRGNGVVQCPESGGSDDDLLGWITDKVVTRVAIDAPFGWPNEFVDALNLYRQSGEWPDAPDSPLHQPAMRLRMTDFAVHGNTGLWPLSVSTDRIGVVAMRCARLLAAAQQQSGELIDRSGEGRLLEVYPAAALHCWAISPKAIGHPGSYKGKSEQATARRRRVVDELSAATSGWLEISEKAQIVCADNDDCLDALISALVARAAERGLMLPVEEPAARTEGWIRLPRAGSLSSLGRP
jgi:hypothetical protein